MYPNLQKGTPLLETQETSIIITFLSIIIEQELFETEHWSFLVV